MRDRHVCCTVWMRYRDGNVQRGCPHCWKVSGTHAEGDEDLARRLIDGSIRGHGNVCPIPVRWGPVRSTTVATAQQDVRQTAAQVARQRLRESQAAKLRAARRR